MRRSLLGYWSEADIPSQSGRVAVITGANSGLGFRSAQALASRGARVLLACRSLERGQAALELTRKVATEAEPELISLDLADLDSVRETAHIIRERTEDQLNLLMNNAGIMATPHSTTKDGFELQFGTNYLGHVALTWLLLPALRNAGNHGPQSSRVITLSSIAAALGKLDFEDPHFERRRYNPALAYAQSKLANQVFAVELDRRLRNAGENILSVVAHPGYTATRLGASMAQSYEHALVRRLIGAIMWIGDHVIAQKAEKGVLPQLFAATAPEIQGGEYLGPRGLGGFRGYPVIRRPLATALESQVGTDLWNLTAKLVNLTPDRL
jgi:NAD(P)-dependent dehydrogenase (short-subunit alcohol dehydrogenase family)